MKPVSAQISQGQANPSVRMGGGVKKPAPLFKHCTPLLCCSVTLPSCWRTGFHDFIVKPDLDANQCTDEVSAPVM